MINTWQKARVVVGNAKSSVVGQVTCVRGPEMGEGEGGGGGTQRQMAKTEGTRLSLMKVGHGTLLSV